MTMRSLMLHVALCIASGSMCGCEPTKKNVPNEAPADGAGAGKKRAVETIQIIPGKSIGAVRMGVRRADLPADASLEGAVGRVGAVRFLLVGDVVDDVWIEGLEADNASVQIGDSPVPPAASIEQIQSIFGTCKKLEGTLGGTFYNCAIGVAVGVNLDGKVGQIRLKLR